jgi:carbon monoxide dehydrogenase subunit G
VATIDVSTHIPAGIDAVWADIERLESHSEWMADAESIEFVGEHRRGVGTTMKVVTRIGPLRTTDLIRVVSWEQGRSIGVVHEGLITGAGEFRLEPEGDGTRFTWQERLTVRWYLGGVVTGAVAGRLLRWVWRRNLRSLARRFC